MNIGFDENTAIEEFIIDIRDKNQVIKHRYALTSKDIEKNILMSEHYIELEEFELDVFIKFARTDFIIWEGEKYMIKEDYIPDEINKINYKYTLRFDHWTTFLQDDTFYYTNQNLEEADWSLMSNAATHFQLIADNANRYFGVNTFNVGTIEFAEMKLLQFSKVSIWNAATLIADAYKAEWYLTGTTFHLVKKFSYGSEVDFEAEVSVEKMDRSEGENSEKYTRILSFGSTRNIPANYRETTPTEAVDAIYQKRLRIPASKGNFIDIRPNLSPEEVKSAVVIFDEIYPKRIGTMSSISTVEYTETDETTGVVTKWNAYRYKDTGLTFKEEYRLPGIELRISFQSGPLIGTDYEVKFNPLGKASTDPESQLFEIIRNEDYGKALPNNTSKPQNGDTFILYGFDIKLVSDQYIPAAELELYNTAVQWLADNNKDKSVFECPTMIEYFEANEMDLEIGQKVKLIHSQFEGNRNLLLNSGILQSVGGSGTSEQETVIWTSLSVYLRAGETYTLSAKADGIWGSAPGSDTVQMWIMKDKQVVVGQYWGTTDTNNITFTVTVAGTYWIRIDSNRGSVKHTFSEFKLEKGDSVTPYSPAPEDINGAIRSSRIQGYEKHLLNKYQATYTVGDNAAYSWPKDIEESIKELQIAGVTYQATGRNGVYLIKQFDNTPASDFNAYSAKASDARYLNRISGGTVQGDTTFQKKVKAKEVISDQFGNETFMPGMLGNGFKFWVENGLSFGQLDYLTITREMIISVLTVAEVKSVDGGMIISSANMICNKTEETTSGYKCYFDNDNGNIPNKFVVGDQAICRRFNGANVKYYWRLVLEIGTNHILLSKTDKDGSGIPSAKDNIVQFGNRTNTQRQFAVYTVGYGDAGTYYYYGVNSYDLTGKAKTYFDKTGARIDGDSIIFSSSGKSATTVINESKQDAISTAATDATNKVNAIQVGGSNLLGNSGFASNINPWMGNGTHSISLDNANTFNGYNALKCVSTGSGNPDGTTNRFYRLRPTVSGNYLLSFYAKADQPLTLRVRINNVIEDFQLTTEWKRFARTTPQPDGNIIMWLASSGTMWMACAQLEEGNKVTGYRPSTEDIQSNIDAANTAANNAATAAGNAQTSANTANSLLADIANDNLLIPSEKQDVLKEWQIIQGEYPTVVAQATTYSVSSSDYTAKYNALNTYITPLLSSMTTNSAIVGTTFRSTFKAYYDAKIALLKLVTDKAKTIADAAQSSADTANAGLLTKVSYSEYNAQMTIVNNQISSKVSQTDFNSLNQRVGTTESQITQQSGQISSVVTQVNTAQTTADNASTAASNANTNAQNAQTTANSKNRTYYQDAQPTAPSGGFSVGDIWQKVTLTDISGIINSDTTKNVCRLEYRWNGTTWVQINVNISGSYVTQTNDSITSIVTKTGINGLGVGETLKSLIDQTPGQIELAVSAIKIGGSNLLDNSSFEKGIGGSVVVNGSTISRIAGGLKGSYCMKTITSSHVSSGYGWQNLPTETGKEYVMSCYAKADTTPITDCTFGVWNQGWQSVKLKTTNISTDWTRLDIAFIATGTLMRMAIIKASVTFYVDCVQLEEGNKVTSWKLSQSDIQTDITDAQTAAQTAATAASNADTKATTANNLLTDIANDNKLDPAEKQSTKKEWDIIVSEYSKNIAQANSFTVSTTVYTSAYNALSSYITPLLSNLNTTSDIVGTTFRSNFKSYYDARTDLLNAVSTKVKAIADSKTDLDTVKAGITINADGVTAFGNQFKVDSLLIANAIQTEELSVGNGNFKVGTDGKISAKGAALEGSLEIGWDGDTSKPVNRITVIDRSSSTQKTKVLITPQNITALSSIGGNTTNPLVVAGGAATSRTVFGGDPSLTWNGASIVLSAGKTYDVVVPAIALTASGSGNGVSGFDVYLDNLTTGEANLVAARVVGQETYSINQAITLSGLQAGTYRLRITIFAYGTSSYSSFSIPANARYIVRPITDAVEIGANGMCGIFTSDRYFHATTDGFYIRMGRYGFRISESYGIQKSTNLNLDNPTWANI